MGKDSEARGEGQTRILAVDGPALDRSRQISTLQIPAALVNPALTTTVTGSFVDLSGNPVTSGQVRFELKPSIATVIQNQNVVEPSIIIGSISPSGQLLNQNGTGPCVVVQNTVLEPGGTYYEVSIWPEFIKTAVFNWYATQANQDISASVPLPPVLPFVPTYVSGGVLRIFQITASGTYTPSAGVRAIYVECQGAGGSGGSAKATSSNSSAAGGGGSGGYSAAFITPIATGYAVTVGAGGAIVSGGTAGNVGGDTIFGASLVVAHGGGAGTQGTAPGTVAICSGAGQPGATGIGDLVIPGEWGGNGVVISNSLGAYGSGGRSFFGSGSHFGNWINGPAAFGGLAALGYGAGAGGGINLGGTYVATASGQVGGPGLIRVWEFG